MTRLSSPINKQQVDPLIPSRARGSDHTLELHAISLSKHMDWNRCLSKDMLEEDQKWFAEKSPADIPWLACYRKPAEMIRMIPAGLTARASWYKDAFKPSYWLILHQNSLEHLGSPGVCSQSPVEHRNPWYMKSQGRQSLYQASYHLTMTNDVVLQWGK